jgi:hypothetical protein
LKNWKMNPMCRRRNVVAASGSRSLKGTPLTYTSPRVGRSKPARRFRSVLLPEPLGR